MKTYNLLYENLENVKILYSAMKNLSVVEASNENLWAGMAHSDFWDYVKYRNSFDKKEITENLIKNTFFFSHGKRKSLIMHPLARLWWTGHLVYDGTHADPFELLNVFKTDFRTKLLYLFLSSFSSSPTVTKAFLSAVYDFAAVHTIGKTGQPPARSRFRLGRRSDQIVLYHYPAFIQNRHHRRLYAGLRSGRR